MTSSYPDYRLTTWSDDGLATYLPFAFTDQDPTFALDDPPFALEDNILFHEPSLLYDFQSSGQEQPMPYPWIPSFTSETCYNTTPITNFGFAPQEPLPTQIFNNPNVYLAPHGNDNENLQSDTTPAPPMHRPRQRKKRLTTAKKVALTPEERKAHQRWQNNIAATRSRAKRWAAERELELHASDLEAANARLRLEREGLLQTRSEWRDRVCNHLGTFSCDDEALLRILGGV